MATDTRATVANIIVRSDLWDSGIRSVEALGSIKRPDGAKPQIAVTRIGSATWIYGKFIISKLGLADAVEFVSVPDGAPMLGALRTKRIDALVSNNITYFAVMDDNLGKPVFDTSDKEAWDKFFGSSIASQCVFALESQIIKNPQLTQGIVNGVYRGLKYIEKNPPEKLYEAIKGHFLPSLEPKAVIREIAYMRPLFDLNGVISKEAYQNGSPIWFNEETKIAPQPYADMVDFSFLENAKKKYG
jgi:NitT/TauT family transport system substrate-binding protein